MGKKDVQRTDKTANQQTQQASQSTDKANCSTQPTLQTPVDLTKATGILYPGQRRGEEYKAHGGFRFDHSRPSDIVVKAPLDAEISRFGRYTQSGDVQMLLEFTGTCGITYRFDHVLTLAPKFEKLLELFPTPADDSRTKRVDPPLKVKAGEVIATAVGSPKTGNIFVDFGVYDTQYKNAAAANPEWLAQHQNNPNDQYGVCWLDWLPAADKATVKSLPSASRESGTTSDYCR